MHGDEESWYKVPDDRELASQYFLLYELSLPFGLDPNHQVSFDKTESKVLVTLREQTTKQMIANPTLNNIQKDFGFENDPPKLDDPPPSPLIFVGVGANEPSCAEMLGAEITT